MRRRKVISERAIVQSAADAVRLALALGETAPDDARAVAAFDYCALVSGQALSAWLERAEAQAGQKVSRLSELHPVWKRLVSISWRDGQGNSDVLPWEPPADSQYDVEQDADVVADMLEQAESLAAIALGWSIRNPEEARDAFEETDSDASFRRRLSEAGLAQLPDSEARRLLNPITTFEAMARAVVAIYAEATGGLSDISATADQ